MRRSIGISRFMSRATSSMERSWSGVSSNGNDSASSRSHGVSIGKLWPLEWSRAEYRRMRSAAISRTRLRTRTFERLLDEARADRAHFAFERAEDHVVAGRLQLAAALEERARRRRLPRPRADDRGVRRGLEGRHLPHLVQTLERTVERQEEDA